MGAEFRAHVLGLLGFGAVLAVVLFRRFDAALQLFIILSRKKQSTTTTLQNKAKG
ncbi:MAG: hypothetical protein CM15mP47_3460 [Methanobacteriota archaeon]|nr:MAG: hypothetical protein CM15mP47_3460 [Euryarchaeota archaeon]